MQKTALDRYEEIVIDALKSTAKVRKSFKTAVIITLILYMVIPRKINFKQMGRYSQSCEQRFRQSFEREFDWVGFNTSLMWRRFGRDSRKAIAIDASYISKAGKRLPISESYGRAVPLRRSAGLKSSALESFTLMPATA